MSRPDSNTGLDQALLDRAYGQFDGPDVSAMRKSFELVITKLIEDGEYDPVPGIAKSLVDKFLRALGDKGFEMLQNPVECKSLINGLVEGLMEDDAIASNER